MPNVKISGPISYTYLEVGKKRIHLFGDEHSSLYYNCNDKSSVDIIKFLKNKFKLTTEPIDFFVEQHYNTIEEPYKYKKQNTKKLEKNIEIQTAYLGKVRSTFLKDGCFRRDKKKCNNKYPNIRFHAGDFRGALKSPNINKIRDLYWNYLTNKDYMILLLYTNNISSLKKELSVIFNKFNTISKIVTSFRKCLKTKKMRDQFIKISPIFRKKVELYIEDTIEKYIKQSIKYDNYVKELKELLYNKSNTEKYKIKILIENIYKIFWSGNDFVSMFLLIMDSYLIARMMKDEYNNIIVYAGEVHIQNYILFFTKYMKGEIKSIGKTSTLRCITIKDFKF